MKSSTSRTRSVALSYSTSYRAPSASRRTQQIDQYAFACFTLDVLERLVQDITKIIERSACRLMAHDYLRRTRCCVRIACWLLLVGCRCGTAHRYSKSYGWESALAPQSGWIYIEETLDWLSTSSLRRELVAPLHFTQNQVKLSYRSARTGVGCLSNLPIIACYRCVD